MVAVTVVVVSSDAFLVLAYKSRGTVHRPAMAMATFFAIATGDELFLHLSSAVELVYLPL